MPEYIDLSWTELLSPEDKTWFEEWFFPYEKTAEETNGLSLTSDPGDQIVVQPFYPLQESTINRTNFKRSKYRRKSKIALGICLGSLTILIGLGVWLGMLYNKAAHVSPDPTGRFTTAAASVEVSKATEEDPFPQIDWEYWQEVNPDVIGWVTIPETNIDYPIMQEREWAQGHYLNHDVYGNWNYCGTPYLSYECAEKGLDSKVSPIAGHHMTGNEAMFAQLVNYLDKDWAEKHQTILLQSPNWEKTLHVQAASVIPGWEARLYTEFETSDEKQSWWDQEFSSADVVLSNSAPRSAHIYLFYTCSYFFNPANERTLVFATDEDFSATGLVDLSSEAVEKALARLADAKEQQAQAQAKKAEKEEAASSEEEPSQDDTEQVARKENDDKEETDAKEAKEDEEKKEETTQTDTTSSSASPAKTNFSSQHVLGSANAHMNGATNEWQDGYYIIGANDVSDFVELERGSSFTLDGKRMSIEKVVGMPSNDYVANRNSLGWNKILVQAGGNIYVCSDGKNIAHTSFVEGDTTYIFDPETGNVNEKRDLSDDE